MPDPLQESDILADYRSQITQQDYSPKPTIDGVEFIDLPHFADDGGTFIEVARFTDGLHDWAHGTKVEQLSYSEMLPGVLKAFHCHFNQEDIWFVPPSSRMLVGLYDLREKSATAKVQMRFIMGAGKARAVKIPRGVAHGLRNIDNKVGFVLYCVSQKFSPQDTDERRLPWDLLGEDFWEVTKG